MLDIKTTTETGCPLSGVHVQTANRKKDEPSLCTDTTGCVQISADTTDFLVLQKEGYFDMLVPTSTQTYQLKPFTPWEDYVINDETLEQCITYSDGWEYYNFYPGDRAFKDIVKNKLLYNTDAHGTTNANETITFQFKGPNLRIFVLADSYGGQATVSIDDAAPVPVSFYRPRLSEPLNLTEENSTYNANILANNTNNSKAYNVLFECHDLTDAEHTVVLRTGDAPNGDPEVCRAVFDFFDLSDRPIFNRFNFAPYCVTKATPNGAFAAQRVMSTGSKAIAQVGFVTSTNTTPTVADHITFADLNTDGRFSAQLTGLMPYTRYHCRPFAVVDGMVYYGHESTSFRTLGTVRLSHEMYGGFPNECFILSATTDDKELVWDAQTIIHPTSQESMPPEEILLLSPLGNSAEITLIAEGNVLVKAIDAATGELCAACDITVARQEKTPLAKTPPMGWNSWNCFLRKVNVDNIGKTLDAMAIPITKDGRSLKDCGYTDCVIDGGWRENFLDENGGMIPSILMGGKDGIRQLADKAHALGLALGLHISPGDRDCASQPIGAKWNEATHYAQFRDWGVTFLKIDQCDFRPYPLNDPFDYARWMYIRHKYFMDNSGGTTRYSISNYHFDGWQHEVAHMWRTSKDIATSANTHGAGGARWNTPGSFFSIYECANASNNAADYAGENAWNDAEMCVVGDPALTDIQGASHFNLWCILTSPLILGNDLRTMSEKTIETITNPETIAVNQDALCVQGRRLWKKDSLGNAILLETASALELWAKPLADGSFAALLLNNTDAPCDTITLPFADLSFVNEYTEQTFSLSGTAFSLRDLNTHQELGVFTTQYTTSPLAPHESVMLKVTPV